MCFDASVEILFLTKGVSSLWLERDAKPGLEWDCWDTAWFYGRIEEPVFHGMQNLCGSIGGFYVSGTTPRD